MAASYKTPGVYIEEISKFPPSVAQVETAIPAFIGYTQQASKNGNSLINIPTKISSLVEYEQYFGTGFDPKEIKVVIDENNNYAVNSVTVDSDKRFYTYDAVHLFYDNGGNECYITSVGLYLDSTKNVNAVTFANMNAGLNAVEREPEPTIILFPDAGAFATESDLYSLQQAALMQCAKLQDRVSIFDLYERKSPSSIATPVANFRSFIGINDLNYGQAYTPWLYSSFDKTINYGQFFDGGASTTHGVFLSNGTTKVTNLATLTSDSNLNSLVTYLENSLADAATITADINSVITQSGVSAPTLDDAYKSVANDVLNGTDATIAAKVLAAVVFVRGAVIHIEKAWNSSTHFKGVQLTNDVKSYGMSDNLFRGAAYDIISLEKNAILKTFDSDPATVDSTLYNFNDTTWLGSTVANVPIGNTNYGLGSPTKKQEALMVLGDITKIYNKLSAFINTVINAAANYVAINQQTLYNTHPIIGNIVNNIEKELDRVPSSGAVAGIYARVDAARGVWKAPANESINSIIGPVYAINNDEQADLNVDPIAGKSINAIRAFTGKGVLVWGARTLAGNDNDWRYISVRRFMVMVEQSCKNAAGGFVFEPNDANTWAKVQGMIENFLTLQWRAGALQGAKASDAFFVSVGLNKTMSALDILEGRMIVEIGMAVVHPAEFIILRFSQLMAQS
ncbi:MAG TPA: phage tail sheath C-terminal domain-containing protein [Mucilaginibacter sp.]